MIYFLLLTYVAIVISEYRLYKTVLLPVTFTVLPYVVITFLNNVFMSRHGFYIVNNEVIWVLLISLIPLYIGVFLGKCFFRIIKIGNTFSKDEEEQRLLSCVENRKGFIYIWFIFCCLCRAFQIIFTIKTYGMDALVLSDFSELGGNGIPTHLFMTIYPLAGILFFYGIKKKKLFPVLLFLGGLLLAMASMIKYHAIIYILFAFVFCILMDPKLIKKLVVVVAAMVVSIFVGNYIIGFALAGVTKYGMNDYLIRLWDYVGGSMINGNVCLEEYGTVAYTVFDIVFASLIPLVNLVCGMLFNFTFPTVVLPMGLRYVSEMNTTSNVMGLMFGVLYTGSWIFFVTYVVIWGMVIEVVIQKVKGRKNNENMAFYSMILTISVLTFFANYLELSAVWELAVWCYLIPHILVSEKFGYKFCLK